MSTENTPAYDYTLTFVFHDGSRIIHPGTLDDAERITNQIARTHEKFTVINWTCPKSAPTLFNRDSLMILNINYTPG